MNYAIEVDDLHFRYQDGAYALRGVLLRVPRGARVAIMGPNGAGKSTLLLHLNGILLSQKGTVMVEGIQLNSKTAKYLRTRVGLVFQDPDDQVISSTVWEDVAFGPSNMGLGRVDVEKRVRYGLEAVGLLGLEDKAPHRLSYGQKKRVAIAGVLAMKPSIIVLDEPTAYLDASGRRAVISILETLHAQGATIVVATHDVDFAAEWADRIAFLRDGRTVIEGSNALLADPELVKKAGLTLPIPAEIFRRVPELNSEPLPTTVDGAASRIKRLLPIQSTNVTVSSGG